MVTVNVVGRLGIDAEIIDGKRGKYVSFRMAVDDYKDGERTTTWMRVSFDGERALKIAQYLKKGSLINVMGNESVSIYTDREGHPQVSRDITAFNLNFISVGKSQGEGASTAAPTAEPAVSTGKLKEPVPTAAKTVVPPPPAVDDTSSVDDLPF